MSKKYLYTVWGGDIERPYVYGNVKACWETIQKIYETPYTYKKEGNLALTYSRFNALLKKYGVVSVSSNMELYKDSINVDTVELNEVY
tara:strand:- start:18 stop:281 length:264 start_codon:yes stop_codon:yes gene_type:complete